MTSHRDDDRNPAPPEARVGPYRLGRMVGRGGVGTVYEATHVELRRRVALKTLRDPLAHDGVAASRLRREARTLERLRHPGIVAVLDLGFDAPTPFMAMEFLDGESLAERLAGGAAMPVAAAVDLVLSALSALAAVHEAGVVHRDIKPSNLFVVRDAAGERLKVLDFGLCTELDASAALTRSEGLLGTPHYVAPESLEGGGALDRRADLYAVALVLYECVTGRRAFLEDRVLALVGAIARGVRAPPGAVVSGLPEGLAAAIVRGYAIDPARRFQTAEEFAGALLPFASPAGRGRWERERAPGPPGVDADEAPAPAAPARGPWWIAAAAAVSVAVGAWAMRGGSTRAPARPATVSAPRAVGPAAAAVPDVAAVAVAGDAAADDAAADGATERVASPRPRAPVRRPQGSPLLVRDPALVFGGGR